MRYLRWSDLTFRPERMARPAGLSAGNGCHAWIALRHQLLRGGTLADPFQIGEHIRGPADFKFGKCPERGERKEHSDEDLVRSKADATNANALEESTNEKSLDRVAEQTADGVDAES